MRGNGREIWIFLRRLHLVSQFNIYETFCRRGRDKLDIALLVTKLCLVLFFDIRSSSKIFAV